MPSVAFETWVRAVIAGMCTTHMAARNPLSPNTTKTAARAIRTGGASVEAAIDSTVPARPP